MALASLEITNRDAITSVLKFFHELILSARQHEVNIDYIFIIYKFFETKKNNT